MAHKDEVLARDIRGSRLLDRSKKMQNAATRKCTKNVSQQAGVRRETFQAEEMIRASRFRPRFAANFAEMCGGHVLKDINS